MSTLLIIILIVLFFGGIGTGPWYGYSRSWGYGPSGILWALLVLALILWACGWFPGSVAGP